MVGDDTPAPVGASTPETQSSPAHACVISNSQPAVLSRGAARRADRRARRRGELVDAVRLLAAERGVDMLSRTAFTDATGVPANRVYRLFSGWPEVCRLAGIAPRRSFKRLSDDDIFSAMRDAFIEAGGIPSAIRFRAYFRHSSTVFSARGLNWTAALLAFRDWAERNAPDFPHMGALPRPGEAVGRGRTGGSREARAPTASGGAVAPAASRPPTKPPAPPPRVWPALPAGRSGAAGLPDDAGVLGELIHFRGLAHAPVNEQGVVMLFGAVARDLGYAVEAVRTAFPDCLAKRRVSGGRWQRVRVEFEYRSRSFSDHGHDADGCDVIVCWTHDWIDCPLEVLELKSVIGAMAG